MNAVLCTGSWKLRHDEPLLAKDPPCHLHAIPEDLDTGSRSVVVEAMADQSWSHTLANDALPLALMQRQGDGWLPTHLLLRLEPQGFQLIHPPRLVDRIPGEPLHALLRRAFADNHLYLNNFECFYTTEADAISCNTEFRLDQPTRPERDASRWLRALQEGRIDGFCPVFCDEWRIAHYRVLCASIDSDAYDAAAFLVLDEKRKPAWNSGHGRVMVRCRHSKAWSTLESSFAGDAQALLVQRCQASNIVWIPAVTCLSAQVCCEAQESGRLFGVCFEWFGTAESAQNSFSNYRARIAYLKTLGLLTKDLPAVVDQSRLSSAWQRWAWEEQIEHQKPSACIWDTYLSAATCGT